MQTPRPVLIAGIATLMVSGCVSAQANTAGNETVLNQLVALEKSALDRWIRVDPGGYLDLYASEATYFDPQRDKRVDGIDALRAMVAPLKNVKLPFTNPRYEMIDPRVQQGGDMAVLTFNLVNYAVMPNQTTESLLNRWNATEVYQRQNGSWRIIHTHWSYTRPKIAVGASSTANSQ